MSMRSVSSPRRVYPRSGSLVCTIAGKFFGPRSGKRSAIDADQEVTTQVLRAAGGVDRIQVTQFGGTPAELTEVWTTKVVEFKKRAPKAETTPAVEQPGDLTELCETVVPVTES
jgi:hypothetical protein